MCVLVMCTCRVSIWGCVAAAAVRAAAAVAAAAAPARKRCHGAGVLPSACARQPLLGPEPHPPPARRSPTRSAGFAWMLLGERLGAKGLAGAAIILASSLVTQVMGGQPQGDDAAEQQQQQMAKEKAE